jgi:ABC-type branched-subunit amino acid transport system ATPase component/ABC-type branched-subunit amino acid transport system permease subunit
VNTFGLVLGGAITGLQYGLLAIGLVLVYRASRFVNFAHSQIGAIGSLALARLVLDAGVPYFVALPLALAFGGLTGIVVERLVIQRLFDASRLVLLIATIGVTQLLFVLTGTQGGPLLGLLVGILAYLGVLARWRSELPAGRQGIVVRLAIAAVTVSISEALTALPFLREPLVLQSKLTYPLPFDGRLQVGKTFLSSAQILTMILAPAIAIALTAFFAYTQTGRNIRAAASNPEAARLAGISVRRVSLIVWVLAGVLSTLAAILVAPGKSTLDTSALGPDLLIRGLAAALIAGMTDFRVAFAAGVGLGIIEEEALRHFSFTGRADLSVFLVLGIGILVRGPALAKGVRGGDDALSRERSLPPLRERVQDLHLARNLGRYGWLVLFGILALLPQLHGLATQSQAQNLTLILSFAIVGLSLTLLTGWAGQLSLGHFAFLGIGAYTAAELASRHVALPLVLLLCALNTGITAVGVGFQALRFRGLFLAVATLSFAVVAPSWAFRQGTYGEKNTGYGTILIADVRLPFYGSLESKRGLYYVTLVVLGLCVAALVSLRRSNIGRSLIAVRDNENAASSHGLTPASVKILALFLSGCLAGIGGALWGSAQTNFTPTAFAPALSLTMVAITIVGGLGSIEGPIIGAFLVFGWPYLIPGQNTAVNQALSAGVLLMVVLLFVPDGVASLLARGRAAILAFIERGLPERPFGAVQGADPLVVTGAGIRFGGLQALLDVDLLVRPGEIVGLIGGNGAGKSTLMNIVSGHLAADSGSVVVFGQDVTGLAPEFRPGLGLARTFQDAQLYPGLTVRETVMVALDRTSRTGTLSALLGAPWMLSAEKVKRAQADEVLARVGLSHRADALVSELSTGMRRLCDIAVVSATRPGLILLDEPTAGIAQREVEQFAPLLRSLRDDLGCAILIVEHDVPLMVSLCDRLYALESGTVLTSGAPTQVVADPRVVAAYLGGDVAAIDRSGGRTPPPAVSAGRAKVPRKKPTAARPPTRTRKAPAS